MVRYAVGYRSRAIVTFGKPLSIDGRGPDIAPRGARPRARDHDGDRPAHKVLPTAVVANAMRPSITRRELEARADAVLDTLRSAGANLGVQTGAEAVAEALEPLEARGIIVAERGRVRVRDRNVLRYYARTLDHLLASPSRRTH